MGTENDIDFDSYPTLLCPTLLESVKVLLIDRVIDRPGNNVLSYNDEIMHKTH
jgi:hypothetical protein